MVILIKLEYNIGCQGFDLVWEVQPGVQSFDDWLVCHEYKGLCICLDISLSDPLLITYFCHMYYFPLSLISIFFLLLDASENVKTK